MEIQTERLVLVAATADISRAEHDGVALAAALGARLVAEWPPEAMIPMLGAWSGELLHRPDLAGWFNWHWLENGELVGLGGFKGEPDDGGAVEIGYALVPSRRGRGLAREALAALLGWAFSDARLRRVDAEASADNPRSIALLEALGFRALPAIDPEIARYALARAY